MNNYRALRNNLIRYLIITLLCLVSAEFPARLFWYYRYDVPFFNPGRILYAYYPELMQVDETEPEHNRHFNILLLGGSVLHSDWGSVEKILTRKLIDDRSNHKIARIFDLAEPAHTSRDSLLKYAALDDARFDLVVYYHGINEVRANNVPPWLFRDNYDHYSWYEIVNMLSSYRTAKFALPYTMRYIGLSLKHRFHSENYVPIASPRSDWTSYGKDPRSVSSFKRNTEEFLDIATQRNDHVLLLTFALYVPKNYSWKRFWMKDLDYASVLAPIELWGEREHVEATVALHNDVIKELAFARKGVGFIDMARLLPRTRRIFNDPCHLTYEGSQVFADILYDSIISLPQYKMP